MAELTGPGQSLDHSLERAAAAAMTVGKPLKIRIQPDVYDYDNQRYTSWSQVIWTMDVQDVEEGRRLRRLLQTVLAAFAGRDAVNQEDLIRQVEAL